MTVAIHSFVADSSLLDSCDLVGFLLLLRVCVCVCLGVVVLLLLCVFLCVCVCVFFVCLLLLFLCVCVFHLMLGGRQPFGVLRWLQLLFLSFGVSCLLAIFRLKPAFVVWSFFLCHRHLWSVLSFFAIGICVQSLSFTAFSAAGIRVRLFVFALLALVSGYQCISQFLVSCCALAARQLHPWRFELEFFPGRLPCGQPYRFRFGKPHLVFRHKV